MAMRRLPWRCKVVREFVDIERREYRRTHHVPQSAPITTIGGRILLFRGLLIANRTNPSNIREPPVVNG
jgi:hypothetical protein